MIEKVCGVYKITCLVNGKIYIGRSKDIAFRWNCHLKDSLKYDGKKGMYSDLRNYGVENFSFEILHTTEDELELKFWLEPYYIKKFESHKNDKGYNLYAH